MRISDWSSDVCSSDLPVLLAGMLAPPNLGRDYGEAFNAIYPRLAEQHDVPPYPFFLEGVAAQRALNQADGIHPNATGVAEIVARIKPHVVRPLEAESLAERPTGGLADQNSRAHVSTTGTNAQLVCRPLLDKQTLAK